MDTEIPYAILRTLSYFHVFHYPLTKDEIWKYLTINCSETEFEEALSYLQDTETIYLLENYYSLSNDYTLIIRRMRGNELGKRKLKKAMRISRFLGLFPFVEAVFVSGSLSKDFAEPGSDLDYFVVTSANRMWTARNLLHLFRKLTFAVNAQRSFCMNYFISLQQPEIAPRNFYTALELATLKTGYANSGNNELVWANGCWVHGYLPNVCLSKNLNSRHDKKGALTRAAEWLINKLDGDKVENWFYRSTVKRWRNKWQHQGHDVEQCMESVGRQFNTPVNFPVHLPNKILSTQEMIYEATLERFNDAFVELPEGVHLQESHA